MADFVYEEMLAWRKAHVRESTESGQVSDGVLRVFWTVPIAAKEGARDWLKANRSSVEGTTAYPITVDGADYEDTYRLVRADYGEIRAKTIELVATYALDHDTTLDWTNARVDEGFERQPDDEWIRVVFPSINHSNLKTLRDATRDQEYTDPVINGDTFTGTYKVLATTIRWSEDQSSGDLLITMGDPQHSLKAFRDVDVPSHEEVTYFWNVPDKEAQALIDGFQNTEGTTVTVSRPAEVPGTVNIVVAIPQSNIEALEAEVGSGCDTTTITRYKWNLTKADLEVFLVDYRENTPGQVKSVQVSYNSSTGRWNATGTIQDKHLYGEGTGHAHATELKIPFGLSHDSVVGIASHITHNYHYRWNLSKDELELFANEFTKEKNRADKTSVRFSISRHAGGCIYDALAIIERVDSYEEEVVLESKSSKETTEYNLELSDVERADFIAALDARKEEDGVKSLSLSRNQNGNFNAVLRTNESKPANKSFVWNTGAQRHTIDWYYGQKQKEAFTIIDGLEDDGATSDGISMSRGGNGYYNLIVRSDTSNGDSIGGKIGNIARTEEFDYKWGISKEDLALELGTIGIDDSRTDKNVRICRNGDGTIDLQVTKIDEREAAQTHNVDRGVNYLVENEFGWSGPIEKVPQVPDHVQGTHEAVSLQRDANGNIDYVKASKTVTPFTSEIFVTGSTKDKLTHGWLFSGYTSIPQITGRGSVEVKLDKATGTYEGMVREVILAKGDDLDPWKTFESGWMVYRKNVEANKGNHKYTKDVLIIYKVLQTFSRPTAEAFLNEGPAKESDPDGDELPTTGLVGGVARVRGPLPAGIGSKIDIIGGDRYRVTFVDSFWDGTTKVTGEKDEDGATVTETDDDRTWGWNHGKLPSGADTWKKVDIL